VSTPHEMTITRTHEPGLEEWSCTTCGRRLLLRRPPQFEKTVLAPGDEWAMHVGGTGGLELGEMGVEPPARRDLPAQERDWLAEHGIEWEA
jgi:hypothetical protein